MKRDSTDAEVSRVFLVKKSSIQPTCSVVQSRTRPSSNDALELEALDSKSMKPLVAGLGISGSICSPHLLAVVSKKLISRRTLLRVLISRSKVRNVVFSMVMAVSGRRILPINRPTKLTKARETWASWANQCVKAFAEIVPQPACERNACSVADFMASWSRPRR
jgi:hypothetical protein